MWPITSIVKCCCLVFVPLSTVAGDVVAQDTIPWPAGNLLQTSVFPAEVNHAGNNIRIVYSVRNQTDSRQPGSYIAIRTILEDYRLAAPLFWFESRGMVQDSAAAKWFAVAAVSFIDPGDTETGFVFEGVGLLDIVAYRVQGHYEVPSGLEQTGDILGDPPSFWLNSDAGFTVGVSPFDNSNVEVLLVRIRTLQNDACDLAWISNPGVCNSLRTKLEEAGRALERGRNEAAVGQLQAFLNELEAQHGEEPGKHVNDNAYWLLKVNVEFILERMTADEA